MIHFGAKIRKKREKEKTKKKLKRYGDPLFSEIHQHPIVSIPCYLLAFFRRQTFRVWQDAHTPQVQTVGVKAGIDGWVSRLQCGGMKTTRHIISAMTAR